MAVSLGQLIRYYRKQVDWTLDKLELKTNRSISYVSRVETGKRIPNYDFVEKCIQAFDKEIKRSGGEGETGLSEDEKEEIWDAYRQLILGEHRQDWGPAPSPSPFFGREEELKMLNRWIKEDGCQLVCVYGMEGMGKAKLVSKFARDNIDHFARIQYLSLETSPSIEYILRESIRFLSGKEHMERSDSQEENAALFIDQLKKYRCLVILEGGHAILQEGSRAGHWRSGFEAYGHLLQRVAKTQHQSCLLLISRERLEDLTNLEADSSQPRSLRLEGLTEEAALELLEDEDLSGTVEERKTLVRRYAGHPFMLKYVSAYIREQYDGQIARFLAAEISIFGGIRDILDRMFTRLSPLETDLILWLATQQEPLAPDVLLENTLRPVLKEEILDALSSLHSRSWIERVASGDTVKGIVLEYISDRLIKAVYDEVDTGQVGWLNSIPLIRATAKDHVRKAQIERILKPVASLLFKLGTREAADKLQGLVTSLHDTQPDSPGYTAGNLINLCVYGGVDLTGWDFSHLAIWEAYLPEARLHDVSFAGADFKRCIFKETGGVILSVAFSPDRKTLAAALSNCEIQLRGAEDGEHIHTFRGHADWVTSVVFSPDGHLLASGAGDNTVRLWDVQTGSCHLLPKKHTGPVRAVAFSQDGSTLASGSSDNTIRLWNVEARKYKHILGRHGDHVRYVAFSPAEHNKHILASCGNDKMVKLWDIRSRKCLHRLEGHDDNVRSVAFSPNGHLLASASRDRTVRAWDVQRGELLHILPHQDYIRTVAFSPDGGLLASGGDDQFITVWHVETGELRQCWKAHEDRVRTLVFHPDGRTLVSGSDDRIIRWWDVETAKCLKTHYGYYNSALAIAFGPGDDDQDDLLVSGDEDHVLRIWDVFKGKCIDELKQHRRRVQAVTFCHDGSRLASSGDDQLVYVWDWHRREWIQKLEDHADDVKAVAFSPSGDRLASGSADKTIRIWDVRSGLCLQTLEGHTDRVIAVAFTSADKLVSGSEDATVRLWDIKTGKGEILGKHSKRIRCAAYSPQQHIVASGDDDGTIKLWNLDTGGCKPLAGRHTERVRAVAFSPDGQTLASGGDDKTVRLWDVQSLRCLRMLREHTSFVPDVVFNRDGRLVASCDESGAILIWEQDSGKLLNTLKAVPPYSGMNISGATGLDRAQRAILKALGATEGR